VNAQVNTVPETTWRDCTKDRGSASRRWTGTGPGRTTRKRCRGGYSRRWGRFDESALAVIYGENSIYTLVREECLQIRTPKCRFMKSTPGGQVGQVHAQVAVADPLLVLRLEPPSVFKNRHLMIDFYWSTFWSTFIVWLILIDLY
jgi:hypothetical protein